MPMITEKDIHWPTAADSTVISWAYSGHRLAIDEAQRRGLDYTVDPIEVMNRELDNWSGAA